MTTETKNGGPQVDELVGVLGLSPGIELPQSLQAALLTPEPRRRNENAVELRAQLLEFAFGISDQGRTPPSSAKSLCEKGVFLVESVQTGRYAWALEGLRGWNLTPEREVRVSRCAVQAVLQCEFGETIGEAGGLDAVPQDKIADVCLAAMELNAGTLMQLAGRVGAILGGAPIALETVLADFGKCFGVATQMFYDINHKYEGLAERRPSWVWSVAAQYGSAEEFAQFQEATRLLPETQGVDQWLESQALDVRAKSLAIDYLNRAFDPLEDRLGADQSLVWVRELAEKLRRTAAI